MKNLPSLLLAGLLPFLLFVACPGAGSRAPSDSSLVLIVMDTARADHFSCYGYSLNTSPAVDRLARQGALFEDAFTHATNTVPSHASLFTGLYPIVHRSHFNGSPLSPKFETLATVLSRAGYRTAAFVSGWTMNHKVSGLDQGFQVYDDNFPAWERSGKDTVGLALEWLRSRPADRPYFLFVHLFSPHGNYDPPAGYAEKFREGEYAMAGEGDVIPTYQRLKLGWKDYSHDPLDYISRYDGEIHYDDEQIGRLLEAVGKDPVVVFAADHGETLVDRYYYFDHGDRVNEEQIRAPLIMRFPDPSLSGKRVKGLARLVDVLPTLLEYLGRPVPEGLQGTSLLPGIRRGTIPAGVKIFSEARSEEARVADRGYRLPRWTLLHSVRTDRYKLIVYPTEPRPTVELFDLTEDPGERRNLAAMDSTRADEMFAWIREYLALGPPPVPPEPDVERDRRLRSLGYVN